jgi:putative SbcD/Mre11-related phosphoesterase
MFFQPITNKPALYIPSYETLMIADLHIGIENELREYGVHTNSHIKSMEIMLQEICEDYKPKDLVLLGDIKHSIPSAPFYEKKHIFSFLKKMQQITKVHLVPGNHDGWIKQMIPPDIIIHKSDGFQMDHIGFFHGHRWPSEQIMNCKYLFCGHTHPTIKLTDRMGYHSYESCWVKTPLNQEKITSRYQTYNPKMIMMILPVFNPLCGGISVNDEGFAGPIKHLVDPKKAEIYLLDGSFLGTLNHLYK